MSEWHEIAHYTAPLYSLMCQARYGQRQGLFVYYVQLTGKYCYVGQTYNGVRLRLWQHVRQLTPLGEWLLANEFADPEPICGAVEIDADLDMAERYYISLLSPTLNRVQYKTSVIFPPLTRCEAKSIQIKRQIGPEFGAVTGLRKDRVWAGARTISTEQPRPHILDSLYEKAHRDPLDSLYEKAYRRP